ncbi:MAG: hypothetical protein ACTS22_04655 [Phycisphaerales bacterium]
MNAWLRVVGLVLISLCCRVPVAGQPTGWTDRLESLSSDDPEAYFLLAEEVADVAASPEELDLARRLFVLSFWLAGDDPTAAWLRPSVCIALAAIEPGEERRRWLRALATRLDASYGARRWDLSGEPDADAEVRLRLAEFVGLVRSGDGTLARDRLDFPGALALAERYQNAPLPGSAAVTWPRLLTEAEVWPCPECGNARTVVDPGDRETGRILCPTCRGNPGPLLTDRDLAASVAFEAVVLSSPAETWSAEASVNRVGPLRDPDPAELSSMYRIDVNRTVFRDGRWITDPRRDTRLESDDETEPAEEDDDAASADE